jgi:hypothetical protein
MLSCKKNNDPHVPPNVVFKTGSGYLFQNDTVIVQDTLLVGITATKTEDDLKSYNISVAYDGSATTSTFYNYLVQTTEYTGFSKDVQIITRNQPGTEKWIFSVVDRDGNITQKNLTLIVQ